MDLMDLIIYLLGLVLVSILSWWMANGIIILEHKIKKYESSRVYQWIRRNIISIFLGEFVDDFFNALLDEDDNSQEEKDNSNSHS